MLTDKQIVIIEALLAKDKRVEITPTPNGAIITKIDRVKIKY